MAAMTDVAARAKRLFDTTLYSCVKKLLMVAVPPSLLGQLSTPRPSQTVYREGASCPTKSLAGSRAARPAVECLVSSVQAGLLISKPCRVHPVLRHARPPRRHRRLPLVLQRGLSTRNQRRSECERSRTIALRKDGPRRRRQHSEEEETAVRRGEKVKEGESADGFRCGCSARLA